MKLIMPDEDYVKHGYWKNKNLFSYLEQNAKEFGQKVAFVDDQIRFTYEDLVTNIKKMAGAFLANGIQPGDVVSFQLPNWGEAVVIYKALQMIGAIANPITPIYRKKELEYILSHAKSKMIFIPNRFRNYNYLEMVRKLENADALEKIVIIDRYYDEPQLHSYKETTYSSFIESGLINEDVFPINEEIISLLIFTSGTTSDPKGVLMSHNTLNSQIDRYELTFNLQPDDVILALGSFGHVSGLNVGVEVPLRLGCKTVHQVIWEPKEAINLIIDEGVTWALGATPFLKGLLSEFQKLDQKRKDQLRLKHFICGGADIPPDLIYEAQRTFNCFVGRTYGASEAGSVTLTNINDTYQKAATTEGKLHEMKKVKIVNDDGEELPIGMIGEIAVKGPDRFLGYLQPEFNEDSFTEDGWFLTGDLGVIDEDDYLEIKARKKDIIIRGGENISVKEVEDILYQHPSIANVAIVAMPDVLMGEKACAYVVLNERTTFSFEEMTRFLTEKEIARQKFPERLEVIEELPMNANGKIQKFKLREDIKNKMQYIS